LWVKWRGEALLDRITDRAHIIVTGADSYRFRRTIELRGRHVRPRKFDPSIWSRGAPVDSAVIHVSLVPSDLLIPGVCRDAAI